MQTYRTCLPYAIIVLVALAGCGPAPTIAPSLVPTTPVIAPTLVPKVAPIATASVYPLTITDSAERKVTIARQPQTFVSLSPSVTEILFTLGLGNQLVAVDQFSDYPPGAKSILNIGGSRGSYNFEKIVELQPDVVLGAGPTSPETIQKLDELKLTVVIVGSRKSTMENIMDDIRLTGKIAGVPERARQVTDAMQTKLTLLKAKVADARTKPKVYWEIDATNLSKPFSVGPGNFVNDIITLAGGENIFASTLSPFPQISTEQIVAASPDVIILVSRVTPESVKMRAGWDTISAVKNGRIFVVDENLTSRTGPRVVDGLEAAMKLIHPELFQ